jgi:DNA topoisomerase I
VLAAAALAGEEEPPSDAAAKRTINRAVKTVAAALGNTPAVCRRSYIDPRVFDRYRDGETIDVGRRAASEGRMSERTRQKIEREVLGLID